jgi:hypothetical protein
MLVDLVRFYRDSKCILSRIFIDNKHIICALELPYIDNKNRISSIPPNTYNVKKRYSPKYKNHFHILNVPGRDFILIHSGNYTTQTNGCILVGLKHSDINSDGIYDVVNSKSAMKILNENLPENFNLCISEIYL